MASVPTRDFFDLVKAIGESKSKQEEDRIVADEVSCQHAEMAIINQHSDIYQRHRSPT